MRIVKLCHGQGNGIDKACLMTAANMLIGKGADGDKSTAKNCICPIIRRFIIKTNDAMPSGLLSELYGPLVWEILGTRSQNPEVNQARAFLFADWAVRSISPIRLAAIGKKVEAEQLKALPKIDSVETARYAAHAAAYAADAAADAAHAAAYAAAYAAADAAAYAAEAAADADACDIWRMCPDIIRAAAAIGDKRPVETLLTHDELADALTELPKNPR